MYKVLLVDDEKLERESIARLIDWEKNGIKFIGAAKDGIEAYEMICKDKPDIVITDIKMPEMNGLQLIEKVKNVYPAIVFAILSGYGEYEYTSIAMLYGVRHYILKPCDGKKIIEVIEDIKKELHLKEEETIRFNSLKGNFEKVLPLSKEQFLRELVLTNGYSQGYIDYYKSLYNINNEFLQLIICIVDRKCEFEEKSALRSIAEEIQPNRIYLSAIMEDEILLLTEAMEKAKLLDLINSIRSACLEKFSINVVVAVSDQGDLFELHTMYDDTRSLMKYRYLMPEGSILTKSDVKAKKLENNIDFANDYENIVSAIKEGKADVLNIKLKIFFSKIELKNISMYETEKYCKKLYQILNDQFSKEINWKYENVFNQIAEYEEPKQMFSALTTLTGDICRMKGAMRQANSNMLVETIIKCIMENINNPELSLTWIAKEVVFMNEEYLGRIFHKTMNEKFSQYVHKMRMEIAKNLIESSDELKVYKISKIVGFEDSQYFSKLFKKYTGFKPSEYNRNANQSIVK